jgi:hypothetical protein
MKRRKRIGDKGGKTMNEACYSKERARCTSCNRLWLNEGEKKESGKIQSATVAD